MFAPNLGTITITNINTIEGGITMFGTIIILVLAAIVADFLALALINYTVARAMIDAIPFDPDAVNAAIASIPGNVKRLAKTIKTVTKEAWHTTVDIAHNIHWAIGALSWLGAVVFNGICENVANLIANSNAVIDAAIERIKRLRGAIRDTIGTTKAIATNIYGDISRVAKTMAFYAWRFGVGIKDVVNLALDFAYATCRYVKAHIPGILTAIQVGTWKTITGTVKTVIYAINTITRFVRDIIGIFAAIGKLIRWIAGGIGLDTNNALAKVANKF